MKHPKLRRPVVHHNRYYSCHALCNGRNFFTAEVENNFQPDFGLKIGAMKTPRLRVAHCFSIMPGCSLNHCIESGDHHYLTDQEHGQQVSVD
jgi:hypothetical protein